MPHENIYDANHPPAPGNPDESAGRWRLQVSYSPAPTSEDGPLGHVQVITENTGSEARIPRTPREVLEETVAWVRENLAGVVETMAMDAEDVRALASLLSPLAVHAFGDKITGYAVTLDRDGINRAIRKLRTARDRSYGADA